LATQRVERRLAAILAADVAGYSRLMSADEEGTHERLKEHFRALIYPKITEHHGRIVKNTGDGLLAEFPSAVNAVRCAAEIQRTMIDRNANIPEDKRIRFRIGVNLGDVIVEPEDIFGEDVNIASRLEALAEPGGICISRAVRDRIGERLPYSFEDIGEQSVKNIAHPVYVFRVRLEGQTKPRPTGTPDTVPRPPVCLPYKASIAVLPFQNMSGDPEQDYFADGMVEEIITALSRIRWLFVIARNSSFTYKGQAVDVKQVGRELGVCYVLEGSVRKTQNRLRISAQLIDAGSGAHLWADRFEGSLEDVFQLQDNVALSVAGVIEPALQAAETACAATRPATDLTAYDLYLRAYATHLSAGPQSGGALRLVEQAIERDPHYGPALALAAVCRGNLYRHGRSEDPQEDRRKAAVFARRALQVAGDDPRVLADAAYALAFLGEDIGAMIALVDRALALNPSFARGWYISGGLRLLAGQLDVAIEHAESSLRLSPRERVGWAHYIIGATHFFSGRFEEAVQKFLLAMQEDPSDTSSYRILAACYAHMGRLDQAREVIARLRAITPKIMPNVRLLRNHDHRELYLSGVRMAVGEKT
jgi:TolB-like protein/class 3 adenylate cyclase